MVFSIPVHFREALQPPLTGLPGHGLAQLLLTSALVTLSFH